MALDVIAQAEYYDNSTSFTIVGLNYGANVALEISKHKPLLISELVLMDPPILMENWVKKIVAHHIEELKVPGDINYAEKFIDGVLMYKKKKNVAIATKAFKGVKNSTLVSVYENLLEWDKGSFERISEYKKPILHIQSQTPFCSEDKLKKFCSHAVTSRVFGSGHWMTLEVPEQVNAMIKRFMELNT